MIYRKALSNSFQLSLSLAAHKLVPKPLDNSFLKHSKGREKYIIEFLRKHKHKSSAQQRCKQMTLCARTWEKPGSLGQCRTYHEGQNEGPDLLPDLWGDVIPKLLQGGEEALQLAELPGSTRGWELLVGQ